MYKINKYLYNTPFALYKQILATDENNLPGENRLVSASLSCGCGTGKYDKYFDVRVKMSVLSVKGHIFQRLDIRMFN